MASEETERRSTILATNELLRAIVRAGVPTRAQRPAPVPAVGRWARDYLADPATIESGQALTPILRLVPVPGVMARECLLDTVAHIPGGVNLVVTLKNASSRALKVTTAISVEREFVDGREVEHHIIDEQMLQPGATVSLRAELAALMLQKYSRSAWPADMWTTSGAIPENDDLVEIGYTALNLRDENGNPISSEAKKARRKAGE